MRVEVDAVLDDRAGRSPRRQQTFAVTAAFLLHALAVTAAFAVPRLTQEERTYPEYVQVHVLPAAALGVERPRPSPAPPPEPAPAPEPEPAPPPKPPEPDLPALPREEPAPAPLPAPRPAPQPETQRAETPPEPARPTGPAGSPAGSPGGSSSLGAQVTGPGGAAFPYDYYLEQMLSKIRQNWVRPPVEGIETVIGFRVLPNGEITEVDIRESSGSRAFDLAALRAVRNASPLPPLPASYRQDHLTVNLIVR